MSNKQHLSPTDYEYLRKAVGANKQGYFKQGGMVYYLSKFGTAHLSLERN